MAGETDKPIEIATILHVVLEMPESDFIDLQVKENQADYFKRLFKNGMLESN
jgi:hypothetical protein